jgi:superfamily II DNA/RNA helicase
VTTIEEIPTQIGRLLGQLGLRPRGIQIEAIDKGLLNGRSVMVCSPTGSGKTMVGEMALLRSVMDGHRGLYLVPLRALAIQVVDTFRERYSNHGFSIGISTGDFHRPGDELGNYDIIVTTYERADSLLRHKTSWLNSIGTIVIDEIQTLSQPERGPRLEGTIIRFRRMIRDLQIIALSATIGMPYLLAEWLGCELVHSTNRPVPLVSKIFPTKDKKKAIRDFVMTTVQVNGQAIVFMRTRREAEVGAFDLSFHVGKQLMSKERAELDSNIDSIENWNVSLPTELRTLIHDGVAYHHAGLNASSRRLVERLFRRGLVRVIFATTTLAAGMDLPARTVVITSTRSPADYQSYLSNNHVHQMLGRAGRPGKDKRGFGIMLTDSYTESRYIEGKYFESITESETGEVILQPKYEPVISQLNESNALAEQLLVFLDWSSESSIDDIEQNLLSESFLFHLGVRDTRAPMRLLNLGDITASNSIERYSLSTTVRAGREGVLGTVKLREVSDSVIGGIVTSLTGGHHTCRFSAKTDSTGMIEGPMCSCGQPLSDDNLLCTHLVALGLYAISQKMNISNYIIPLALSDISPLMTLTKLSLVEGSEEDKIKPTHLGRIVNRLYLRINAVREMLPILSVIDSPQGLLFLLKHLINLESPHIIDDKFENTLLTIATTNIPLEEISRNNGCPLGDILSLMELTRWLLYSIAAVADVGGLIDASDMSNRLLVDIDKRLNEYNKGVIEDGS